MRKEENMDNRCFYYAPDSAYSGKDTYRIECRIVIYRQKFGKHPDFLKEYEGNKHGEGYNTKFFLLIEDDISDENTAKAKVDKYNKDYADLISKCENSGEWGAFPFKSSVIVYYK